MCTCMCTHTRTLSLWAMEVATYNACIFWTAHLHPHRYSYFFKMAHTCNMHTNTHTPYFKDFTFILFSTLLWFWPLFSIHILSNLLQTNFIDTNICSKGIWNYKHPYSRRLYFKHECFAMEILAFFTRGIKSASCLTASNQATQLELQLCTIIPCDRSILTIINSNAFR